MKVREINRGWCRLPMSERTLRTEVEKYFERCAQEKTLPTPSGLALTLDVRTRDLSDERLSDEQRRVLSRAMQRMEVSAMERMITQGGMKGIERVLESVEEQEKESGMKERLSKMTDEQIRQGLRKAAVRIEEMLKEEEP